MEAPPAFHRPSHPSHSAFPRLLQSGDHPSPSPPKLPCAQGNVEAPAFRRPSRPAHSAFPRLLQSGDHPSPSPSKLPCAQGNVEAPAFHRPSRPAHSAFPRLLQSGGTLAHPPHQAAPGTMLLPADAANAFLLLYVRPLPPRLPAPLHKPAPAPPLPAAVGNFPRQLCRIHAIPSCTPSPTHRRGQPHGSFAASTRYHPATPPSPAAGGSHGSSAAYLPYPQPSLPIGSHGTFAAHPSPGGATAPPLKLNADDGILIP